MMNRFKSLNTIKIFLWLMFALQVGVVCSAADQPGQLSLYQKAKGFVAKHSVATTAIGLTLAAGAYSFAAGRLGLPTIIDTIKKDLFTGSQEQNKSQATIYHLLHGVRLLLYNDILLTVPDLARSLLVSQDTQTLSDHNRKASEETLKEYDLLFHALFLGPVIEEHIFTYWPRKLFAGNKYVKSIAPLVFGVMHSQYNILGMITCAIGSFMRHQSLDMRPEYGYAPIISHILHNAQVVVLLQRKQMQQV